MYHIALQYIRITARIIAIILSLFILMAFVGSDDPCYADENSFTPWNFNQLSKVNQYQQSSKRSKYLSTSSPFIDIIRRTYQAVSAVDGDRCQMTPTCSAYSIQVMEKHGFIIGFVMTADRLIHESDEMYLAPLVQSGTESRFFDPVSHNDFWWYEDGKLDK